MSAQPTPKSDFIRVLAERGYIHQQSHAEELDAAAASGVISAYIGFDATASSLHVGNLLMIMLLRRLQQTGHKPIIVMGGGTTKVGDPSGKDAQRQMLTEEKIAANIAGIKRAFAPFLTFGEGPTDAIMVDNDEWLSKLGYVEFLREYGPHFTINRMLTFDSVKLRLDREQPLTFLEFNYMLMQAADFLELNRRYGCSLQMGGSDQWGNILNGVELIRRKDQKPAFALTSPLITTASGAKMGKTAEGAVWLNAELRSPYDYWQFWRNTEDADVGRFLRLFTELPLEEIARLEALEGAGINEAKKVLANEATAMLHGVAEAERAASRAKQEFDDGIGPAVTEKTIIWDDGQGFTERTSAALVVAAGLEPSLRKARVSILAGQVSINGVKLNMEHQHTLAEARDGVFEVRRGRSVVHVKPL